MSVHNHPTARRKTDNAQRNEVAGTGEPPYDGGMEARVAKLEADLTAIKIDLAVIKANGAAKSDIAELRSATKVDIADAKNSIIMWVVGAIFMAQLLPALLKLIPQ